MSNRHEGDRGSSLDGLKPEHHGTTTGYVYGCRCEKCGEARREYMKEQGRKIRADSTDYRHGTLSGYVAGCRCVSCRSASREWKRNALAAGNFEHGTSTGYVYGCRCEECKEAAQASNAASLVRRRDIGQATLADVRIFAQGLGMPVPMPGPRREALIKRYNRLHPDRPFVD